MNLELNGKTALVSGASAGIGRGIALAMACEGVHLALLARRGELLEEVAREIVAAGGHKPLLFATDLAASNLVEQVKPRLLAEFVHLDILVNVAGGSLPVPLDADDSIWLGALAVQFHARRRLAQAFLPQMQERRWGRIINITGTSEPRDFNAATSSKAATHAWAKGLSREVGKYGITINSVSPGRIVSEQVNNRLYPTDEARESFAKEHIPLGYFGEPEEMANVVLFLASSKARYINGEIIHVDGGLRQFAF